MQRQWKQNTWFRAPDGTKGSNALVAKEAGVSVATVANVFRRPEVVIPETKQRVLDAVIKLEYLVNELPTMKKCTACKSVKPPEDFYNGHKTKNQRNATNKKYPHSRCKECEHKKNKIYHKENRSKVSERQVMTQRRKKYGVSEKEYKNMVLSQNNICAICNKPSHKTLHVDHDHITGKVRGLLCSSCNLGIGMLEDNIDTLNRAIKYLS